MSFSDHTKDFNPAKYNKGGLLQKIVEARATWFNFDSVFNKFAGNLLFKRDMVEKKPPVSLSEFAAQEVDLVIKWQEACKEQLKIDTSIKNLKNLTKGEKEQVFELWGKMVHSSPEYLKNSKELSFHMWHVWSLPPASYKVAIARYLAIGSITGIAGGLWFRYGYHIPERRKLDAYYKQLYKEHPEYWPALKVKKGKKVC